MVLLPGMVIAEKGTKEFAQQQRSIANAALVLTHISFSGWHIVGAIALHGGAADPLVFALYREIAATILMYGAVFAKGVKFSVISTADYNRFLLLGVFSCVNVVGSVLALQHISASRYALFQPSIPCFSAFLSILLGMEELTWGKGLGIALSVLGAIIIESWNDSHSAADEPNIPLGTAIALLQSAAMACVVVFQKSLVVVYDAQLVTFTYYGIGCVLTVLLCFVFRSHFQEVSAFYFDSELQPWMALGYATLFPTLCGYNAISWAGKHLNPSTTAIYSTLQPVGTVLMSYMFFGQMITAMQALGGLLVSFGLFFIVRSPQSRNVDSELISHVDQL